jgi:hypothetical protein
MGWSQRNTDELSLNWTNIQNFIGKSNSYHHLARANSHS